MVPGLRSEIHSTIRLKLPTFVVVVLRERAKRQQVDLSEVVERLILEDMMLDEVQRTAEVVPGFGRLFTEWLAVATSARK